MQLKTVGESFSAIQTINDILQQMSSLSNNPTKPDIILDTLSEALNKYSTEAIKTALAQSKKLTTSQIQAILSSKGLEGNALKTAIEEVEQLSTSQDKTTFTANNFSLAMKGLSLKIKDVTASIKNLILYNPITKIATAIAVIYLLNRAIQSTTKTLETQKEELKKSQDSITGYNNQLSSLQSDLQTVNDKINEISSNPITIVDQKTLSTLREERNELIQQINLIKALNEAAKNTAENQAVAILANTSKITGLTRVINSLKEGDILGALVDTHLGIGGIYHTIEDLINKDYKGAFKSAALGLLTNMGNPFASIYNWLFPKKENKKSILEETTEQIEKLNASRKKLDNLNNNYLNKIIDEDTYKKKLAKINETISEQTASIITNINTLQTYKATLDHTDPNQLEWINQIKKVEDAYTASLVSTDGYKTFDDILSSDIYSPYKAELIELAKQGRLTSDILHTEYHNLDVLFHALGLSTEDIIEKFKQMGEESQYAFPANSIFILSEEHSKAIDDFQSKINSLKSALDSLRSGNLDSSAFLDLQQEFPSLQNESEQLDQAIQDLMNDSLQSLYYTLGEDIPDNLKNSLKSLVDEATGSAAPSLQEAFSSVQNSYKSLAEFKKAMPNGISDSLLSSIASLSTSMQDLVAGFYAGAVSSETLFHALSEQYQTDLQNYSNALLSKNLLSSQFYNNIILADTKLINDFSKNYGIDIRNCKTYAEAKQAIEAACFKNISNIWTNYYDAQKGTFTLEFQRQVRFRDQEEPGSEKWHALNNQIEDILHAVLLYQQASSALDHITYQGIESNFSSIFNSLGTKETSSSAPTIFDWIETRISSAKEQIDSLNQKLDSVSDYTRQNRTIDEMLSAYQKEIQLLGEAKQKYLEKAEAVGLSASYIHKIQYGLMELEAIENETTKKKIDEYQKWYEKTKEIDTSIEEIIQKTKELNLQKLENLTNDFERVTSLSEAYNHYLQTLLDVKEAKNQSVTESDYLSLLQEELHLQATLQDQYQQIQKEFQLLGLSPIDDAWYEYQKKFIETKSQIEDCTLSIEKFKDTILEIRWNQFDTGISSLENLSSEIQDALSLLGDGEIIDPDGEITDLGLTKIGLYAQQYITSKKQLAEYGHAIEKLGELYKNGLYSQEEYTQKLLEFQKASRDTALSLKNIKKEFLDFHKEVIQGELDAMKELVNSKKTALDAEKDLQDYRSSIANKQVAIQSLEKKIATLALSDARADKALKLQLEEELAKAKEELAEEEKQHAIENQKEALDQEYNAFEQEKQNELKELENNLEKQEDFIQQYLRQVVDNYDIVSSQLQEISESFGISFTENLTSPWKQATNAANLYIQAVEKLLPSFEIPSGSIGEGMSGISLGTNYQKGTWIQETNPESQQYGKWWYQHADGSYTRSGWEKIDGVWYCFDKDGWMGAQEWIRGNEGEWYYLGPDGAMLHSGWKVIDGKDYYFDEEGKLYQNKYTPDGYWVDQDGVYHSSIQMEESTAVPYDLTKYPIHTSYDPTALSQTFPRLNTLHTMPLERVSNSQPVSLNITSPLMVVNGGLDSSIMGEVERKINQIPNEIKQQFKSLGL